MDISIKDIIDKLSDYYKHENLNFEEREYGIGFNFKGEWYNLSGYNFLAQLDIITKTLQPLLK